MAVTNITVTRDLGPVSSYAIAVAEGFQGTRAEWTNYIANASIKAVEATSSALKSEGYAVGKQNGTDVGNQSDYYENSSKYYSQQAAGYAQNAENAKQTILGMSAQGSTLNPGSTPTVSYSNGVLSIGIPPGITFTPSVTGGVLSWTNNGNAQNPQSVDIAGSVRGVFDETVSGTDPVITGVGNHRYLCGEVSTISITPPATGTIDVIFTSGTTAAVLTLPNTVKMPDWFDATTLETSKTYEINITDGVYGAVMSWAL